MQKIKEELYRMLSAITSLFYWFANLFCLSCRKKSNSDFFYICKSCISSIPSMSSITKCLRCHNITKQDICPNCSDSTIYWDSLTSLFPYNNIIIKQLYHLYKFQNSKFAEKDLSLLLSLNIFLNKKYQIIIIPCSHETSFRLGFNPVAKIIKNLDLPYLDIIKRKNFSKKIKQLPGSDRKKQSNFLYIRKKDLNKIKEGQLILVDDILTTGTTLNHAAQILKENGANIVEAFVFFRA